MALSPPGEVRVSGPWLIAAAWLIVALCSLLSRGPMPIDETRYLAVAWEMWRNGHFLVPMQGGLPYSEKPPVLFWLIQAGWAMFGVSEWWPRLLPHLTAAANLALTALLARRLWPALPLTAELAPLCLLGAVFWTIYSTMLMFDMLVVLFTLAALNALACLALGGRWRLWWLVGVALGLGMLSKGPVVLLYTLVPALVMPWIMRGTVRNAAGPWYAGVVAALCMAAAITLAWALPAARQGGEAYAEAILWTETASRIASPLAPHAKPFWWYVAMLPLVWFPWALWRPAWLGLAGLRLDDPGSRFLVGVFAMAFLSLSLVSGKQAHYLLPVTPVAALLLARVLAARPARRAPLPWFSGTALLAFGAALLAFTLGRLPEGWPEWLAQTSPWTAPATLVLGAALLWQARGLPVAPQCRLLSGAMVLFVAVLHLGVFRIAYPYFDVHPVARIVAEAERAGRPVAYVGDYEGEFDFAGRLTKHLEVIQRSEVVAWAAEHPDGLVVLYHRSPLPDDSGPVVHTQRYRGKNLTVWEAASYTLYPALAPWVVTVPRRGD